MNEHKVCLTNGLITGIIGILLMNLFVGFMSAMGSRSSNAVFAHLVTLLFIPMAYYTTKLFIKTKIKNGFLGFLVGGIFSSINGIIMGVLVLLLLNQMEDFVVFSVMIVIFAFIIGSIAGAVISTSSKKS